MQHCYPFVAGLLDSIQVRWSSPNSSVIKINNETKTVFIFHFFGEESNADITGNSDVNESQSPEAMAARPEAKTPEVEAKTREDVVKFKRPRLNMNIKKKQQGIILRMKMIN